MISQRMGLLAFAVLVVGGCSGDAGSARRNGSPAFESQLPPGVSALTDDGAEQRREIAEPPTREERLCRLAAGSADLTLESTPDGLTIRLRPKSPDLRDETISAARELRHALNDPAEYAADRRATADACGVVELAREVAMAEVREGEQDVEVRIAAWPDRGDLLRGRARILVDQAR